MGCQPANSWKGDEEFEQKVQHEQIDPERDAVVPALFAEEERIYGILWCKWSVCMSYA